MRPSLCLQRGTHHWTSWSPYAPVYRPVSSHVVADAAPQPEAIEAYRERECGICGCVERQSWDGKTTVIYDPRGINGELQRRTIQR